MKFTISRSLLLKPLQIVSGVVERRQTLPILSNVLLTAKDNKLSLTGTDLEIELVGFAPLEQIGAEGSITVSARKLLDICKALPEDAMLQVSLEQDQLILRSGKSRFTLSTLPPSNFPNVENAQFSTQFVIPQPNLKKLFSKVYFAMGQQDVRHYLNGALFDLEKGLLRCVATDGHRLAFSTIHQTGTAEHAIRVILPRKGILELMRLLDASGEENATVCVGDNHFRLISSDFIFTTKLINAQYPDFNKLIPKSINNIAITSREALKQALTRASILSNEKFRGIRLHFDQSALKIVANNPEQEEAEELIYLDYQGNSMELGFNAAYLLDVVSTISTEQIRCSFTDPNAGVLIEAYGKEDHTLYVVMPMRL
jgi:DNA polymerase III subunit beta